ncbi:hypothetical protein JCM11251_004798 [Rhodosporidiobolus azoricus]
MATGLKKNSQSSSASPVDSLPLNDLSMEEEKAGITFGRMLPYDVSVRIPVYPGREPIFSIRQFTFEPDRLVKPLPHKPSSAKFDRLSKLPPELLRQIFVLAYRYADEAPQHPLNRTLAPFHYELEIHGPYVRGYRRLKKLMRTVLQRPQLGEHVKHLSVTVESADENKLDKEGYSCWSREDTRALVRFLGKLSALKDLFLRGARRVVDVVLKPSFAAKHLQRLRTLDIQTYHIPQVERSFDPALYIGLAGYRSLDYLALAIFQPYKPPYLASPVPSSLVESLRRLTTLKLVGSFLDSLSAQAILSACEHLTALALTDNSDEADFPAILAALPRPDHLATLDLSSVDQAPNYADLRDVVPFVRRCTQLKKLSLTGSFLISPTLLTVLKPLPLEALEFGIDTPVSPYQLLDFLRPSCYAISLSLLHLDNIFAVRGKETNPDDAVDVYIDDDGLPEVPPGWNPPEWIQGWDADYAEAVKMAALAAKILLVGSTFEAADIEEKFGLEEAKVEDYWDVIEAFESSVYEYRTEEDEEEAGDEVQER